MAKIRHLYCNGDSWTAGDDAQQDPIELWPTKLGSLLNVPITNSAKPGSSNDGVVRTTINDLLLLKRQNRLEGTFVIIGWSSPERKDFFYKGSWDTLYPAQLGLEDEDKNRTQLHKLYVSEYWNKEEYITRHCLNTINLHYFLSQLNVPHLFFNAFYENNLQHSSPNTIDFIKDFKEDISKTYLEYIEINNIIEEYLDIQSNYFYPKSFFKHIIDTVEEGTYKKEEVFNDYHPSELGHELWATNLFKNIKWLH